MYNMTRKGTLCTFYDLQKMLGEAKKNDTVHINVQKPLEFLHFGQKKCYSYNPGVGTKSVTKRREETGTVSKRWEGSSSCERREKNGGCYQGVNVRRQQWFCNQPLARMTNEWSAVDIPMDPYFLSWSISSSRPATLLPYLTAHPSKGRSACPSISCRHAG